MKPGARVTGVAESFDGEESTLAAAVVRADRVVDGLAFSSCTVGGTDATDRVVDLVGTLDREDPRAVLIAGIAPAWFNLVDLPAVADRVDRPACAVSFETSAGLEAALDREFDGDALERRLAVYRRQPDRHELTVNGESLWVRSVGLDPTAAAELVRAFTPDGGRPEPLRVARLAARAADRFRPD